MSELYLDLADIRIQVCGEKSAFGSLDVLKDYLCGACSADHCFRVALTDALDSPAGQLVFSEGGSRVYRDGETLRRYIGSVEQDVSNAYICAVRETGQEQLQYLSGRLCRGVTGKQLLKAIDMPHLMAEHRALLLHASFICHDGKAILFTAPSETGKSTQARLWCDHMGAELINGDRAAVRVFDDGVKACGIPFSGSSPVRKNVTLPLAAIVYLSQAPENTITRLRGVRAFRRIWEGCTVNTWDRGDVEKTTGTVSEVVSSVPVYHLACTPDVRAVELLNETMEGSK